MPENYFQRRSTYALISELAHPMDWTIYVGLGATLDRTGTSWESLVLSLLRGLGVSDADSRNWIENLNLVGASTTIESIYRGRNPDDDGYTQRLQDDMRKELYGPRVHLKGRLLEKLAEFGYLNVKNGSNVVFVTPNYDTYLDRALTDLPFAGARGSKQRLITHYSIDRETPDLPSEWNKAETATCIHVHGIIGKLSAVTRGKNKREAINRGTPVLGEMQYAESHGRTLSALTELFQDRNLLIVGSSLTDGPLVQALINSKPTNSDENAGPKRIVIQPMQGREWQVPTDELDGILELNRKRLSALGLRNTRPQYFGQSAQFISEITSAMVEARSDDLLKEAYAGRYDNRLDHWWRSWSTQCVQNESVQRQHHEWLRVACEVARGVLQTRAEEEIKVEVWSRWYPLTRRQMALWASSMGSLASQGAIKVAELDSNTRVRSVSVFCFGSPQLLHDNDPRERWRSYFGIPIWSDRAQSRSKRSVLLDQLPIGVVTVASMWSGEAAVAGHSTGCIGDDNLERIAQLTDVLEQFGQAILEQSVSRDKIVASHETFVQQYGETFNRLGLR